MNNNPNKNSNSKNTIEEITPDEYKQLLKLLNNATQAHIEDMDLYEFGPHRDLYTYLTKQMGLSVKKGRGPVWHRAKDLIHHYELNYS